MLETANSETILAFVGVRRFLIIYNFCRKVHSTVWQMPKKAFSHLHIKHTFEFLEDAYQRRNNFIL